MDRLLQFGPIPPQTGQIPTAKAPGRRPLWYAVSEATAYPHLASGPGTVSVLRRCTLGPGLIDAICIFTGVASMTAGSDMGLGPPGALLASMSQEDPVHLLLLGRVRLWRHLCLWLRRRDLPHSRGFQGRCCWQRQSVLHPGSSSPRGQGGRGFLESGQGSIGWSST